MTPITDDASPSQLIGAKIAQTGGWRGEALTSLRRLIHEACPDVTETIKWRKPSNPSGVPVWEHAGILCTGETYKDYVKLTFMNGSALPDPSGLFNASLTGVRRAIDIRESTQIDADAFKDLIRAAVMHNMAKAGS
jgi:hypothetical protein